MRKLEEDALFSFLKTDFYQPETIKRRKDGRIDLTPYRGVFPYVMWNRTEDEEYRDVFEIIALFPKKRDSVYFELKYHLTYNVWRLRDLVRCFPDDFYIESPSGVEYNPMPWRKKKGLSTWKRSKKVRE